MAIVTKFRTIDTLGFNNGVQEQPDKNGKFGLHYPLEPIKVNLRSV